MFAIFSFDFNEILIVDAKGTEDKIMWLFSQFFYEKKNQK